MSKAFNAKIIIVVVTTASVLLIAGTVTNQNTCQSVAPSTSAASTISLGMPLSAAERMTVQKPVHTQTPTAMSARLFQGPLIIQASGWKPGISATRIAFSNPVWETPGGL